MRTSTTSTALSLVFVATCLTATPGLAQLPGAPVLQNAFANPGLTVAGNYADGEGTTLGALALAYSPGAGRFQFSGGVGRLDVDGLDGAMTAWGARFAIPLLSLAGGRIGVAPFAGLGGGSMDDVKLFQVPAGVGAGWRTALGTSRALSVYATGTYLWSRVTETVVDAPERKVSNGRVRFAVAADVTVIRNLGLTLGYELGSEAKEGEAGPAGSIVGIGLSWAFR